MFGFEGGEMIIYVVAGVFMIMGIIMVFRVVRLGNDCTALAKARVVWMKEEEVSSTDADGVPDSSTVYTPIFQFYLPNGRLVQAEGKFGSSEPPYEVGEIVNLRYNPNDPEEVDISGDSRKFIIIGVVCFCVGAGLWLYKLFG